MRPISLIESRAGKMLREMALPAPACGHPARRDHSSMAVAVEGVDVTAVVQDRRHSFPMNVVHVVDLGMCLHRDLPVALQIETVLADQAAVLELELAPLIREVSQPFEQRRGIGIEVEKDQVSEAFTPDRLQPTA